MPERVYHRRKSLYNTEVTAHLREHTTYVDWAVTATFYAALHLVDSMLAVAPDLPKDEQHPGKHSGSGGKGNGGRGRNQLVAEFGAIRKAYRSLEEASRRARSTATDRDPIDAAILAARRADARSAHVPNTRTRAAARSRPCPSDS